MDNFRFTNNASALLAANIDDDDLSLTLETGYGALFPSPSGSQKFRIALQDADGNLEICNVTARSSDTLTITRGEEGTSAQAWTLGVTRVELRLTAETMEEFLQKNGGTMTGNLDMDENSIVDPVIEGPDAKMVEGQIVGVPIRGAVDDSSNEILVPDDGSRATAGGEAIRTEADDGLNYLPIGAILMWYGSLLSLPSGWQECNGSGGTPDLRGSFPRGVSGSVPLGSSGGAANAAGNTGASGSHTHTGSAAAHALTVDEMPAHNHRVYCGSPTNINGGFDITASANLAYRDDVAGGVPLVEDTGGGDAHSHGLSIDAASDHTHTLDSISTIPPYVGIYFIMRVS